MKRYCGRHFTADELQTIHGLIEAHPGNSRAHLSRQVCELFDWRKPNGELKDMTCRVAMLRMQADGLFTLPAARWAAPRQPDYRPTHATDPQPLLTQPVHQLPQGRSNRRARQEVPHQQADPPDQGHLALPPSPILPISPLPLTRLANGAGALRVGRIFTTYGRGW